jgi:hypothetical protein
MLLTQSIRFGSLLFFHRTFRQGQQRQSPQAARYIDAQLSEWHRNTLREQLALRFHATRLPRKQIMNYSECYLPLSHDGEIGTHGLQVLDFGV